MFKDKMFYSNLWMIPNKIGHSARPRMETISGPCFGLVTDLQPRGLLHFDALTFVTSTRVFSRKKVLVA